jgi:hypothetical protein
MSDERDDVRSEDQPLAPVDPIAPPAYTEPVEPAVRRRHTGGIWFGVILVLIGTGLLLGQFLPAYVSVWRFWPLIIVALGVRQMFGPVGGPWSIRHLAEGLATIAFGLVFLGQMMGYLGWDVWLNILRLWPLLLVSLGFELIGKAVRIEIVRALGSLVIVAGLAHGALVMTTNNGAVFPFVTPAASEEFAHSAPHDASIGRASARIEAGVGALHVEAGDELVTAEGASPFASEFLVETDAEETTVRVGLGSGVWGPTWGGTRLDVTLDRDVVWDLEIKAGVSQYDVDLRDLAVSSVDLSAGVSNGIVTLPEAAEGGRGAREVSIEAGVSSLTIRVPRGDSARVSVAAGLTGVDTSGVGASHRDGDRHV